MTDTQHRVLVKFEADTKGVEAGTRRVAKEANKLQSQQKKQLSDGLKNEKDRFKLKTQSDRVGGPTALRKTTDEIRKQNKELAAQNKLIRDRIRLEQSQRAIARMDRAKQRQTTFRGGMSSVLFPERADGRNWRSRLGAMAGQGIGMGAGLLAGGLTALLTMPFMAISSQYQESNTYRRSLASMAGLNKGALFGAGATSGGIDAIRNKMAEYGYSQNEVVSHMKGFARATGDYRDTAPGMILARQLGLDPSEMSGFMSTVRGGRGEFGAAGRSDIQRVLAAAVKAGVNASTLPEYLEGVKSFATRAGATSGGAVSGCLWHSCCLSLKGLASPD